MRSLVATVLLLCATSSFAAKPVWKQWKDDKKDEEEKVAPLVRIDRQAMASLATRVKTTQARLAALKSAELASGQRGSLVVSQGGRSQLRLLGLPLSPSWRSGKLSRLEHGEGHLETVREYLDKADKTQSIPIQHLHLGKAKWWLAQAEGIAAAY